jgi:hypothetical protein
MRKKQTFDDVSEPASKAIQKEGRNVNAVEKITTETNLLKKKKKKKQNKTKQKMRSFQTHVVT